MPQTRISDETRAKVARLWEDVVEGLAEGLEVRDVLAMAGLSKNVVRAYRDSTPGALEQWNQAKADSADAYFDRVVGIANNPGSDPHRARVQADMFRWLAGKRNPRDYSDKATLDVNVRTVDLTRIISDANARLANARTIEGARAGQERIAEGGVPGGRGRGLLVDTGNGVVLDAFVQKIKLEDFEEIKFK